MRNSSVWGLLDDSTSKRKALRDKISKLSEESIREKLLYAFSKEGVDEIKDMHKFANRLTDVALGNEEDHSDSYTAQIHFTTSPIPDSGYFASNTAVGQFDIVFAHIQATGPLGKVVVKWINQTTGEVLLLSNRTLNSAGFPQYVQLTPANGWIPAAYQVSIYSMDDKMTPYGSGNYTISNVVENDQTQARERVIEDLINSGQAVPKIR